MGAKNGRRIYRNFHVYFSLLSMSLYFELQSVNDCLLMSKRDI
jgi:hypothetical protein